MNWSLFSGDGEVCIVRCGGGMGVRRITAGGQRYIFSFIFNFFESLIHSQHKHLHSSV